MNKEDNHNHAEHEESHHNHEENHESHNHNGHDHHAHMVTDFRNKFFIILIFTIPIILLSPMIQNFIGVDWQFTGDSYIVAALATFVYFNGEEIFWELATLVLIMLLGHWIEMRAINNASKALESLASLMPDTANRITENGETEEVQIDDIKAGDLLLVKPGEKMPLDGKI